MRRDVVVIGWALWCVALVAVGVVYGRATAPRPMAQSVTVICLTKDEDVAIDIAGPAGAIRLYMPKRLFCDAGLPI